jgi:ligand-binding SRPBCC domain-containing protein
VTAQPESTSHFVHVHEVATGVEETFAVFTEPANLARLTPRLLRPRIVETPPTVAAGERLRYRVGGRRIRVDWIAEIAEWQPPRRFTDVQVRGPYASWVHTHELVPTSLGTEIRDRVEYRLPGGRLGSLADRLVHRPLLACLFRYRSRRLDELLAPARR